MTHTKVKLLIGGLIFVAALSYLAFAGMQKGWVYTMGVDEYVLNPKHHTERVRLCGIVQEKDLDVQKVQLRARFIVKGETSELAVAYNGSIPEMFKPGCEVLIEGKRDPSGIFQADQLMTKCASKYEETPKGHPAVKPEAAGAAGSPS